MMRPFKGVQAPRGQMSAKGRRMFPSTFRRLEVFIAVVDAGSFVGAAERLGIAHPSVSNHIQALERQVRCELFTRRRGTISILTEPGRRLYERGVDLLEKAAALSQDLSLPPKKTRQVPLVISCQRAVATGWLCAPFADYAKAHPEIDFTVNVERYETVVEDLIEGRADLGFLLAFGPVLDLPCERIGSEPFSFFAPPNNPLAERGRVQPSELNAYPFITPRRAGRFGQMVHNMLGSAGISNYSVAYQVQEGAVIQELAIMGLGIFCGPDRLVRGAVEAGSLVKLPVEGPELRMDVFCVLPPNKKPPRAALNFSKVLKSFHTGGSR